MLNILFSFIFTLIVTANTYSQQDNRSGRVDYEDLEKYKKNNYSKFYEEASKSFLLFNDKNAIHITERVKTWDKKHKAKYIDGAVYEREKMMNNILIMESEKLKRGVEILIDSAKDITIYHANTPITVEITYIDSMKNILGFRCQKANIKSLYHYQAPNRVVEVLSEVYFTTLIVNVFPEFRGLIGMPLEYKKIKMGEITHYLATNIELKDIKSDELNIRSYCPDIVVKTVTAEEFKRNVELFKLRQNIKKLPNQKNDE